MQDAFRFFLLLAASAAALRLVVRNRQTWSMRLGFVMVAAVVGAAAAFVIGVSQACCID